ncbi:hypothetical protein HYU12_00705 [Candidatus Woesearchaeota archaeon]|nr:hypothetical protein [Candidatus Woesearchaeota archaeon]
MVDISLGIVIAAAAADSINPCVFGVLIFMLAFMLKIYKSRARMMVAGLLYILAVYITYLLLGFGIFKLTFTAGLAIPVYWAAAVIAIVAGLFEIKDYFWYGKGFTLQIFPGGAKKIKHYVKFMETVERKHTLTGLILPIGLGVFVPFVELPCTGAPYFAILGMLAAGKLGEAVPLLMLYNLVFILPLFIILGMVFFGATSKSMEKWRKEHRGLMRLGIGLFLLALGLYMIWSVI